MTKEAENEVGQFGTQGGGNDSERTEPFYDKEEKRGTLKQRQDRENGSGEVGNLESHTVKTGTRSGKTGRNSITMVLGYKEKEVS